MYWLYDHWVYALGFSIWFGVYALIVSLINDFDNKQFNYIGGIINIFFVRFYYLD